MRILLTNDDGIGARGLVELRRALREVAQVTVVAPDRERSGASHALTLRQPVRVEWLDEDRVSVDGTPTDCVLLAVHDLLREPPDLLISGVNHGPNMGDDVTYSGTVAAAFEGTLLGIPSLAVSVASRETAHLETATLFARRLAQEVGRRGLPSGTLLNVNVPDLPPDEIRGVRWTRLGKRIYVNAVERMREEEGRVVYEIGGQASWRDEKGTDFAAVEEGLISITPVHLDLTDYRAFEALVDWDLGWRE